MSFIAEWFQSRFQERSTILALLGLLGVFGVGNFSPEQQTAIASFAVILVATPDKRHK